MPPTRDPVVSRPTPYGTTKVTIVTTLDTTTCCEPTPLCTAQETYAPGRLRTVLSIRQNLRFCALFVVNA